MNIFVLKWLGKCLSLSYMSKLKHKTGYNLSHAFNCRNNITSQDFLLTSDLLDLQPLWIGHLKATG